MRTLLLKTFLLSLFVMTSLPAEMKQISKVCRSDSSHMVGDGFKVDNYFPNAQMPFPSLSPFVLLDYNPPCYFPPLAVGKRGVGGHPHRGFETVTIVYDGKLAHRDSMGHSGVIGQGDVQWMTAGAGVLHEEFHEENFTRNGGNLHVVQLWVNLPKKDKMVQANYQTLLSSDMGLIDLDGKGSRLRVIAGEQKGASGPASTFTPIELYDVALKKESSCSFALPENYNSMILVLQGAVTINQQELKFKDLVLFGHKGEEVRVQATEDSLFLVLSGEPIQEPVVQSGPFVMNTQEEIYKARADFSSGKFGKL